MSPPNNAVYDQPLGRLLAGIYTMIRLFGYLRAWILSIFETVKTQVVSVLLI